MATPWEAAFAAASSIAAPIEWRRRLAQAIRTAADAMVAAVMTCPPAYWLRIQYDTEPERHHHIMERIHSDFLARIDESGEDWRMALREHGVVYAPLLVAVHRALADELRSTLLTPEGIDGWLVASFVSKGGLLLGFTVVGTRDDDEAALARLREPLTEVATRAAHTLETTIELARGCGLIVPSLDESLPPLTARELQIADLVAQGYSNANVAARLELSTNTIGVHVRKIYRKLGVHSRVELSDAIHRRRA